MGKDERRSKEGELACENVDQRIVIFFRLFSYIFLYFLFFNKKVQFVDLNNLEHSHGTFVVPTVMLPRRIKCTQFVR